MIPRTAKSRLVLWICAFTSVCLLAAMALLVSESYKIEMKRAYSRIEDAARDAADEVEYGENGELSIDDDIVYYRDEVTVTVLNDDLDIIAGRLPVNFKNETPIDKGKMRRANDWIVFDIESDEPSLTIRAIYSLSEIRENIQSLVMSALSVFAAFVLILATVSRLIAQRAFAPLYAINDTLNAAKPGNIGERVALKNAALEFDELAVNVNGLLERVETSFATERRFTADVSHELRTPLGIMLSNVEYAMARPDDKAAAKAAMEECHEQVKRMVGLVTSLLLIARADSGKLKIDKEIVDLSELCSLACEQQREIAAAGGIDLTCDIKPSITVEGDETMLLVVLTNLLDNAIKYHRESGENRFIKLVLDRENGKSVISVEDNGRGIPKEQLQSVWDRFHRVDTAKDSKQGTGLGLSIVKLMVTAHMGECGAESEPGGITRFWVKL